MTNNTLTAIGIISITAFFITVAITMSNQNQGPRCLEDLKVYQRSLDHEIEEGFESEYLNLCMGGEENKQ